jgi:two-component system, LuxR family, response regulator FixJ
MAAHKPPVTSRPESLKADGLDIETLAGSPPLWADARRRVAELSPRQSEVLGLVAAGLSSKEVAIELGCSPRTVEIHRGAMLIKLGVRSTAEAVRIAIYAAISEIYPLRAD